MRAEHISFELRVDLGEDLVPVKFVDDFFFCRTL